MKYTKNKVSDCIILPLKTIQNEVGNITIIEEQTDIPFAIRRIYYLYDVPGKGKRGKHAHKTLKQIMIAINGSFDVILNDGINKKTIKLDRPDHGLLIVPGIWRDLNNFSKNATCLVLASERYDINDYIRNINEFLKYKKDESIQSN